MGQFWAVVWRTQLLIADEDLQCLITGLVFQPKKGGGISFNSTVMLTQCSEKLVQLILHEYSILCLVPPGAIGRSEGIKIRMAHLDLASVQVEHPLMEDGNHEVRLLSCPFLLIACSYSQCTPRCQELRWIGNWHPLLILEYACKEIQCLLDRIIGLDVITNKAKCFTLTLHLPKEIFNAEVLFREDCSPDEFIDVIVGNRVYMPCLYVSTV